MPGHIAKAAPEWPEKCDKNDKSVTWSANSPDPSPTDLWAKLEQSLCMPHLATH